MIFKDQKVRLLTSAECLVLPGGKTALSRAICSRADAADVQWVCCKDRQTLRTLAIIRVLSQPLFYELVRICELRTRCDNLECDSQSYLYSPQSLLPTPGSKRLPGLLLLLPAPARRRGRLRLRREASTGRCGRCTRAWRSTRRSCPSSPIKSSRAVRAAIKIVRNTYRVKHVDMETVLFNLYLFK